MPVEVSIVMPVNVTGKLQVFVPVPKLATKAVELFAVPKVVAIGDPADMAIAELTTIVTWADEETPSESVAVIVS